MYEEINFLNVFNLREVGFLPPHFAVSIFKFHPDRKPMKYPFGEEFTDMSTSSSFFSPSSDTVLEIKNWIHINLKGRFFIEQCPRQTSQWPIMVTEVDAALKIGFEDPQELFWFSLHVR